MASAFFVGSRSNPLNFLGHNWRKGDILMLEQSIKLAVQSSQIHAMNRGSTTSKDNDDQSDHHEIKEPKTGK